MTLTPKMELDFSLSKERGRLPRYDSTMRKYSISEADAKSVLDQFRAKNEMRVRGGEVETEEESDKAKPSLGDQLSGFGGWLAGVFDWFVDKGSVFVAVTFALILAAFSLWIMGPSDFEKVAFALLAGVIVLFGYRFLVKGYMVLWIMCELIAGFLGTSFVLVGIDYQTNLTADDRQLTALETTETNARTYLETLQELQKTKGEGYKLQVENQQKVYDDATEVAGAYRVQVANKPKHAPEIKAYDILLAIPKAVMGTRFVLSNDVAMLIALVLFGAVFFILPATLYTTVKVRKE